MCVDRDPGGPKPMAEDDVGGLPPDPGQAHQVLHAARNLAAEPPLDCVRHRDQVACLGPEEAGRVDQPLKLLRIRGGHRRGVRRIGEQGRRDEVDAGVGALGREDGRHQELEWRAVIQRHDDVRVRLAQARGHHSSATARRARSPHGGRAHAASGASSIPSARCSRWATGCHRRPRPVPRPASGAARPTSPRTSAGPGRGRRRPRPPARRRHRSARTRAPAATGPRRPPARPSWRAPMPAGFGRELARQRLQPGQGGAMRRNQRLLVVTHPWTS